jgi:hypothetical protein
MCRSDPSRCSAARFPGSLTLFLSFLISWCSLNEARADGGAVLLQTSNGSFRLTLFINPETLRAGPVDFSVMVERLGGSEPVVDANVTLTLQPIEAKTATTAWLPPACLNTRPVTPGSVTLTLGGGGNRLLYSRTVTLSGPGKWKLNLSVADGEEGASANTLVTVQPAFPPWTGYWHLLAIPPIGILAFAFRKRIFRQTH